MAGKRNRLVGMGLRLSLILGLLAIGACSQESSHPPVAKEPQAYKLIGIIQGDSKQAGAIFEDPQTKKQRFVQVGQVLGGATLTEVRREEVILKRGDEVISLRLAGGTPAEPEANLAPIPVPVGAPDPEHARQSVISKVIPPYDPRADHARMSISRNEVDSFVSHFEEALKEGGPILTTTPVGTALDLSHVDGDLLRSLGLESTDQVVGINGMGVDSPDRLRQILEILDKSRGNRGTVFNIVVLRGEVVQPLYYGIHPKS